MALIDYSKYDMENFTVEEIKLCHYIRQKYEELLCSITVSQVNSSVLLDSWDKDKLIINCSYEPKCKKPTSISTEITKAHQFHYEHAERLFNSLYDKVYGKIKENPNNPTQKQIKTADLLIATIKKVEVKMEKQNTETKSENNVFKPEYTEKEYEILSRIIERCREYDNNKWVSLSYDKLGKAMYVGEVDFGQPINSKVLTMHITEEEYTELCYKLINADTPLNAKTFVRKEQLFNHIRGSIYFLNFQVRSLCSPFIRPLSDLKNIELKNTEDKIFNYVISYIRASFRIDPSAWMAINKITSVASGALHVKVRIIYSKGSAAFAHYDDVVMAMSFNSNNAMDVALQYPLRLRATHVDIPPNFTVKKFNEYVKSKTVTESNTDAMCEGVKMKKLIETIIGKCELMGKLYDNPTNPIYKIYAIKDVNKIGIQMNALGAYEHYYAFIENVPSSDFVKLYNKCYTIIEDGWHISTKGSIVNCTWDEDNTSHEMIPLTDIVQALENDQKQLDDAQKSNLVKVIIDKIRSIHTYIPTNVLEEEINKKLGKHHPTDELYAQEFSNNFRFDYGVKRVRAIDSVGEYCKNQTEDNYHKAAELVESLIKYDDPLIVRVKLKLDVVRNVNSLCANSNYLVAFRNDHNVLACGECRITHNANAGDHLLITDNMSGSGVKINMPGNVLLGFNHEWSSLTTFAQKLVEQFNRLGDKLPIDLYCKIIK